MKIVAIKKKKKKKNSIEKVRDAPEIFSAIHFLASQKRHN